MVKMIFAAGVVAVGAGVGFAGVPAFPGAQGFGAMATGGRGGEVYHVTNLNDGGAGSFREAVSKSGRVVVFDIGGEINVSKPVEIASDITVAGQTAPRPGVTIYGAGISASGQKNVIVRYLRVRPGIGSSRGSKVLNVAGGGGDMIFDHLSISWGRWDDVGFTQKAHDITLQDSIVAEAIDPQRFGALIDSADRVTVARTIWADNQSRNPKGKGNLQYINNVVYNYGTAGGYVGGHSGAEWKQDLIGNYFIKGPSSSDSYLTFFTTTDHVYQSGNMVDLDRDGALNGRAVTEGDFRGKGDEKPTFVAAPQNAPEVAVTVMPAAEAFEHAVKSAGDSIDRDGNDERVIAQVKSLGKQGAIIKTDEGVKVELPASTEKAKKDSDGDGMPDEWESSHGLDPKDAGDGKKVAASGYTNLEEYLNSLVKGD